MSEQVLLCHMALRVAAALGGVAGAMHTFRGWGGGTSPHTHLFRDSYALPWPPKGAAFGGPMRPAAIVDFTGKIRPVCGGRRTG